MTADDQVARLLRRVEELEVRVARLERTAPQDTPPADRRREAFGGDPGNPPTEEAPPADPADLPQVVRALIAKGRTAHAVRAYAEATGVDTTTAADVVDRVVRGQRRP